MAKIVIIAEKPSMKAKYQDALKGTSGISFTNSIGHIEELQPPEAYLEKREKWYWNDLVEKFPLIPEKYNLQITDKKQFSSIQEMVKDADEIILACDPDREGELIHRNILELLMDKKAVKANKITRVWLHAETKQGIKDGFDKRKDYSAYDGYYNAAKTRSIIDWLVGIQLTVLYSVKYGKPGSPISIGRVQSWLLAEIVRRTQQFIDFKPKDFWTIQFVTSEDVSLNHVNNEWKIKHIFEKSEYDNIMNNIQGKPLLIDKIETKPFAEYAPNLYDLNTLSRDAARKYNISPDKTLELAQSLYEKHELISYPRSDCNVISTEEAKELHKSVELVGKFKEYSNLVTAVKKENPKIEINKKYIGNLKGHYAIIPVFNYSKDSVPDLSAEERNIFDLIVKRFISALLPPVKGEKTNIKANINSYLFYTEIKNIKEHGYRQYIGAEEEDANDNKAVSINYKEGDLISGKLITKQDKTKPEPLFKDESILGLMEKAHLTVKDEKLKEYLKEANGIGTAATRSSFIPLLLKRDYIKKDKNTYIPTQKGYDLYKVLPEQLKYADYSAKLEFELFQMIDKKGRPQEELLKETESFLRDIFLQVNNSHFEFKLQVLGKCPKCGGNVVKGKSGYGCIKYKDKLCDFYLSEQIAGKTINENNLKEILEKGRTSLIKGFTGSKGKYDAYLRLDSNKKVVFDLEKDEKDKLVCPICKKGEMIEREAFYGCSSYKEGCKFSISKEIAGKKLTATQIKLLINKGKTGLIDGFKGKKGEFSAVLIIKNGKVEFNSDK